MRDGRLAVFKMGMKIRVTEEEVLRVEATWNQELQSNRQAWNEKMAERRQVSDDQA
jgi:hypothetical protein